MQMVAVVSVNRTIADTRIASSTKTRGMQPRTEERNGDLTWTWHVYKSLSCEEGVRGIVGAVVG